MRVTEHWWEESTPSSPGSLLSLSVLRGSRTPEVGEVVYSQAENIRRISPHYSYRQLLSLVQTTLFGYPWVTPVADQYASPIIHIITTLYKCSSLFIKYIQHITCRLNCCSNFNTATAVDDHYATIPINKNCTLNSVFFLLYIFLYISPPYLDYMI